MKTNTYGRSYNNICENNIIEMYACKERTRCVCLPSNSYLVQSKATKLHPAVCPLSQISLICFCNGGKHTESALPAKLQWELYLSLFQLGNFKGVCL